MKITQLFGLALLVLSLCFTSCSDGEDGAPGLSGISCWDINGDGVNDANEDTNQDGEFNALDCQGADGIDGVGLEEMIQYGSISLNLNGTRTDGIPFESFDTFRFTPIGTFSWIEDVNRVNIEESEDNIIYTFSAARFLSSPDDVYNDGGVHFYGEFANLGEPSEELLEASIDIDYTIFTNDNKYFTMNEIFHSGGVGVSDFEFTDFVFNSESNNLSFSYSFEVLAANNSTGNPLTVSGDVDVYLLEQVTP
nr:hypothetical protein [uncultured Allomuricauda sp.]